MNIRNGKFLILLVTGNLYPYDHLRLTCVFSVVFVFTNNFLTVTTNDNLIYILGSTKDNSSFMESERRSNADQNDCALHPFRHHHSRQ